jgi:hypothetical protein
MLAPVNDEPLRTGLDVVREILAALAPGELPHVEAVLRGDGPRVPWTPFVLGFVGGPVASLVGDPPPRSWWRRPRRRLPDLVPAFDHDQLRTVWAAAVDAAAAADRSPADREAFAAAVVATLSTGHLPHRSRRDRPELPAPARRGRPSAA